MKCAENLTELYIDVDDFLKIFLPEFKKRLISDGQIRRNRATQMSESEIMTLLIYFQRSKYKDFKAFYLCHVCHRLRKEFPKLLSYERFINLIPRVFIPMTAYLESRQAEFNGLGFIDSTKIIVCHGKRTGSYKVFKQFAEVGMSSMGWFYGFKLHLICNSQGELVACKFTPGNQSDLEPVSKMTEKLKGKLYGDKGYISKKLFEELLEKGLILITGIKKNMKNRLIPLFDKLMLRKRALIESVNNQIKKFFEVEHTRHRSPINGFINMVAALVAYTHHPKKPSLKLTDEELALLMNKAS